MDMRKLSAEAVGTAWLTFGGCGSAVISAGFPQVGIGLVGVSFAFGLTVLTMAYSIGHISGCHLNPAVTVGLRPAGDFRQQDRVPYIVAQVVGAIVGAAVLYFIASGAPDFDAAKGFAANGYGEHSPGHYGLVAGFLAEVVLTMMFIFIIMGATHSLGPRRVRADRDRSRADLDPSDLDPDHQHLGQSGAQHGAGAVRGRLGDWPALDVLGCAADRRRPGRDILSLAQRDPDRAGRRRQVS